MVRKALTVPFRDLSPAEVWTHPVPTEQEVLALPVSVGFAHAARALGYSKDLAYRAVKAGTWPDDIPLKTIGAGRRCMRADLLAHLGVKADAVLLP